MIDFPNAKINIGLKIVNKRPDGYHDLESIFVPAPWFDILEIIPTQNQVKFTSSGIDIPGESKNNLCLKAFDLLHQDFDIPPIHIHLHKNIPIGAGLGGGSADGAFTLKMINQLFKLNISTDKLESYALQLGSDCPFFIRNTPAYVTGTGNELSPIELNLTNYYIALYNPGIHISTKEAYSNIVPKPSTSALTDSLLETITWQRTMINDFEVPLFASYPALAEIKKEMYANGAVYSSMTGSGSTIFGIFKYIPDLSSFDQNKSKHLVVSPFDIQKRIVQDF